MARLLYLVSLIMFIIAVIIMMFTDPAKINDALTFSFAGLGFNVAAKLV